MKPIVGGRFLLGSLEEQLVNTVDWEVSTAHVIKAVWEFRATGRGGGDFAPRGSQAQSRGIWGCPRWGECPW